MAAKFKKGIDLQGQRGQNAADASAPTDLVTLQQMQAGIRGLDWKDAVRAVASTNITKSGTQTIDAVVLVAGDRVLLIGQTAASENGIWVVASGAWTRAADADASAEVTSGMATTVTEGTNKGTGVAQVNPVSYVLVTVDPIVLNTTALVFSPLGGSSTPYTAGNGLTLTGSQFNVVPGNGILADGSSTRVDPSVVVRKYATDCAATTNPQTFTHGLGTNDVTVGIWEGTELVYADITKGSGTVIVDFGSAPTAAQYRVVVHG